MTYLLEELAAEIKNVLKFHHINEVSAKVCKFVQKALMDENFSQMYLKDRKEGESEREILFQDTELGFCICGHVYNKEANGSPHDHGSSWAIYGQAEGETNMTEWKIAEKDLKNKTLYVKQINNYLMKAGDVKFYDVGVIHSPSRKSPVKLLRIEGENLDNIQRSNIKVL